MRAAATFPEKTGENPVRRTIVVANGTKTGENIFVQRLKSVWGEVNHYQGFG